MQVFIVATCLFIGMCNGLTSQRMDQFLAKYSHWNTLWVQVKRRPVARYFQTALTRLGVKVEEVKQANHYEDMFHVFCVIELEDPVTKLTKTIIFEKNETIDIVDIVDVESHYALEHDSTLLNFDHLDADARYGNGGLECPQNQHLGDVVRRMDTDSGYSPVGFNCQDFTMDLLESLGVYHSPKTAKERQIDNFVKQDWSQAFDAEALEVVESIVAVGGFVSQHIPEKVRYFAWRADSARIKLAPKLQALKRKLVGLQRNLERPEVFIV